MISINGYALNPSLFPGGESHIRIPADWVEPKTKIIAHLHQAEDIMSLLMAIDAIRRINADCLIFLTIPYFPYARQDRVCFPGEALSIKVMANVINQLECHQVTVFDPHSDVLPALLHRCQVKTQADIIEETKLIARINIPSLLLLAPDAGAEKKVRAVCQRLRATHPLIDYITASKCRDVITGQITKTSIPEFVEGKNLLLIDDICDGGSTFIVLAEKLKQAGAHQLYLHVTHGIYSKGLEELKLLFEHLYCYNLINRSLENHPSLTVLF